MSMLETARDFTFRDIYNFAALVEDCAQNVESFIELDLEENYNFAIRLKKPHKLSLLHEYIYAMICTVQRREYRKNSGMYDDYEIKRLERVFEEYRIPFSPFESFGSDETNNDDSISNSFYQWFLINEDAFYSYWEKVTDEVFHIVFSNRRFLRQFGESLAEYVRSIQHRLPADILTLKGRIRRCSPLPDWLKKAVFYRDHGRCVFCCKDLSGLIATDRRLNFDHIVPLARWGSNDPSNFQLLCEDCNKKKSDAPARAGDLYVPWWDYLGQE